MTKYHEHFMLCFNTLLGFLKIKPWLYFCTICAETEIHLKQKFQGACVKISPYPKQLWA